ncbi:hypothetical protein [Roseateles sp. MS654]|uniref:hypothetical protein n=1 Tax=Roseateles sp. MS654 TaxID=3412685 RepID=UPI003C2B6EBF
MKFFSAIAKAFCDIKEGVAEGRHQAKKRRASEASAREREAFERGLKELMAAAQLPHAECKAAMERIDRAVRGNSFYEAVRDQMLAPTALLHASGEAGAKLDAIAALPTGERDAMAQLLDQQMRGNPHWETARAIVTARSAAPSSKAEG